MQNHGIQSIKHEYSFSIHEEIGENDDFLQSFNNSKLNYLYNPFREGTVCNGGKQLTKNGVDTKKTIQSYGREEKVKNTQQCQ